MMYSVSPFPLASSITHTQLVYPLVGHDYQFQDRNSSPDRSYLDRDIMFIFLRINLIFSNYCCLSYETHPGDIYPPSPFLSEKFRTF